MSDKTWPSFLSRLDSDPESAFEDFYRLAWRILEEVPPRPMRGLAEGDREDVFHETIYHCVRNNFRILRRYVDRGRPFAAWLYTIAHHKCIDFLRVGRVQSGSVSFDQDPDGKGLEKILSNPADDPVKRVELAEVLGIVKSALAELGDYCRLLLEMASDELTPREMVLVLRVPRDQNKKVSDDLRYCREKLKKRLAEIGLDISSFIGR